MSGNFQWPTKSKSNSQDSRLKCIYWPSQITDFVYSIYIHADIFKKVVKETLIKTTCGRCHESHLLWIEKNRLSLLLHYKSTLVHIYMIATLSKHYTIDLYFKDMASGVLREHTYFYKTMYTYMFFFIWIKNLFIIFVCCLSPSIYLWPIFRLIFIRLIKTKCKVVTLIYYELICCKLYG